MTSNARIENNNVLHKAGDRKMTFHDHAPVPKDIQFGLSNVCNYTCLFCGEHRPGHSPPAIRFTEKMFEMMYDLLPQIEEAAFHENSEFFLDRHFMGILQECSKNNVTLSLNTNASLLTDEQYRVLKNYDGHLNIAVSLDALTQEVYRNIRGGNFDKVISNTRKMIDAVQGNSLYEERTWCKTHTTSAFIIMKDNKHQALEFVNLADSLGFDRVSFYRLHEGGKWLDGRGDYQYDYDAQGPWNFMSEYNELIDSLQEQCSKVGILSWLPEKYPIGESSDSGHMQVDHRVVDTPGPEMPICLKPWEGRIVIKASGDMHPCCHTWGVLGNVKTDGFDGVWNSEKARELRRALKSHLFLPECRSMSCPVYRAALARGDAREVDFI